MACACKVNQEIDRIQRYYAYNKNERSNRPHMQISKKEAATTIGIYLMLLPLTPLILIGLLVFSIFSRTKRISMGKFLRFIHNTRNGKQQQII